MYIYIYYILFILIDPNSFLASNSSLSGLSAVESSPMSDASSQAFLPKIKVPKPPSSMSQRNTQISMSITSEQSNEIKMRSYERAKEKLATIKFPLQVGLVTVFI